jgi:hypothetical protein
MKLYDRTLLGNIPQFSSVPWEKRKPVLFGRFSKYRTNRDANDTSTFKLGVGGKPLCYNANKTCPVREHFLRFATKVWPAALQSSRYLRHGPGR